jgi:ribonuclease J
MQDNQELLNRVRAKVKAIFKETDRNMPTFDAYIKDKIRNDVGQFLFSQTRRRPMVLPVLIEV